jgi:hypothetical protein
MKYRRLIVLLIVMSVVAAYPFIGQVAVEQRVVRGERLYTFGLPQENFVAAWLALWVFVGAGLNVLLMYWRVAVMEKQQESQQKQLAIMDKQQKSQQKQLNETRFATGVQLLGNDKQSARIGGIYHLFFLASEYPIEYLEPVCEILCTHVRTITRDKEYQGKYRERPSNEIQTILNLLLKDSKSIFHYSEKNLMETFLSNADFENTLFNKVSFNGSTIRNAGFKNARLRNVNFRGATLSRVGFVYARFEKNVRFTDAVLQDVDFRDAKLEKVDFSGTALAGYSHEEIAREGQSLELTKPATEDMEGRTMSLR